MKQLIFNTILSLTVSCSVVAQDSLQHKSCSDLLYGTVKAYIVGDNPDSTIQKSHVKSGFRLSLNDTSYRIEKFSIVFEYGESLVTLPSCGDKIIPGNDNYGKYLNNIQAGSLMTVEGIIVNKADKCYKLSPLVYFIL